MVKGEVSVASLGKLSARFNCSLLALIWGQAISSFGDYLVAITLSIWVYRETGSAFQVALVYLVTVLPSIVSIFLGPYLGHVPLRKIMIRSDLLQATIIALIPFVISVQIWVVYLLLFVSTIFSVIFQSTRMALLVDAANGADLDRVNSVDQSVKIAGILAGMAAGGMLSALSFQWAFWVDALTFVISAICVSRAKAGYTPLKAGVVSGSAMKELVEGFRYIAGEPVLAYNVFGFLLVNFGAGMYNAILVVYAFSHLHVTNIGYTMLLVMQMAGLLVTGLGIPAILERFSRGVTLAGGIVLLGLIFVILGFVESYSVALCLFICTGGVNILTNTISRTMMMEATVRERRCSVMNVRIALGNPANTIGATLAGLFIDWAGLPVQAVVALAGLVIAASGVLAFCTPDVVHYDVRTVEAEVRAAV